MNLYLTKTLLNDNPLRGNWRDTPRWILFDENPYISLRFLDFRRRRGDIFIRQIRAIRVQNRQIEVTTGLCFIVH